MNKTIKSLLVVFGVVAVIILVVSIFLLRGGGGTASATKPTPLEEQMAKLAEDYKKLQESVDTERAEWQKKALDAAAASTSNPSDNKYEFIPGREVLAIAPYDGSWSTWYNVPLADQLRYKLNGIMEVVPEARDGSVPDWPILMDPDPSKFKYMPEGTRRFKVRNPNGIDYTKVVAVPGDPPPPQLQLLLRPKLQK